MGTEVFPPQEGELLREVIRQPPELHGVQRSRWRLCDLRAAPALSSWLNHYSLSGVCQALRRLGIKRKQGRLSVHSPDVAYLHKMRWIERACERARLDPAKVRVLYADELSFYRRPHLSGGGVYYPQGKDKEAEPCFPTGCGYNTRHRLGAALDMLSGQVVWVEGKVVGVEALCQLLTKIREAYSAAYGKETTLLLIWDNWPVHYQQAVVAKAAEQNIQLLWLPTYAPWLNPIEKLWRWLKQQVLHNHLLAEQFDTLKQQVRTFLNRFTDDDACADTSHCQDLLRYVGLASFAIT